MSRSVIETLLGALVISVAAFFLFVSYRGGHLAPQMDGYNVSAKFREVGTLAIGSDVRVGGIKVGTVVDQSLDDRSYKASITMLLKENVLLPLDSSASIISDGLLGGKYVALEPGADERMLGNGDEIIYTQDAVSFETLIAKIAFGSVDKDKSESGL